MKKRYRATVAYDGTAYGGWQVQPDAPSVQAEVERVLLQMCQESIRIHSSGRTDAGVHAKGQVIHFDSSSSIPIPKMQHGLNALLPRDIRVSGLKQVADDWHARFNAVKKEYRYFIYNGPERSPFERNTRAHIRKSLDVEAMQRAAVVFVGRHDFVSFAANRNEPVENTVREIYTLDVVKKGNEIMIRAVGNGFLYKMVRSLAGYLIRVGLGDLDADGARQVLDEKKRTQVVPTADAEGLFLWRVWYEG